MRLNLQCFLLLTWLIFCPAGLLGAAESPKANTTRPNVIIILADDLGYGDIGAYGAQQISTPNIDQLAEDGIRFTNFYASANVCTPSRAGLLTGRYPIRTGLAHKVIAPKQHDKGLPQSEMTVAEMFKAQGYQTAIVGKWHLGHAKQFWPTQHGFDQFYGLPYSNDSFPLALYQDEKIIEEPVVQKTLTERYTDKAITFIEKNQHQPFLLYLPHTFPHIPLHVSERFAGRSEAGLYGDTVEVIDWSVGKITARLKQLGLYDNTLIMFSSDNGAWFEGSNANFREMKGSAWDGGYRVPFIVSWPGKLPQGKVSDALSMNIDIVPTLSKIIGETSKNKLDGADLWPVLTGKKKEVHDHLYLFDNENISAVRTPDWKFLVRTHYRSSYIALDRVDKMELFDEPYALLFDMKGVEPERYNRARENPDILAKMNQLLEQGRKEFDPLRTEPEPEVIP